MMKNILKYLSVVAACAVAMAACTPNKEPVGTNDKDGLYVNHALLELVKGETYNLVATVTPKGAGKASFTSADPAIASVDAEGLVTALRGGETVITATSGTFKSECSVIVSSPVTTVTLNRTEAEIGKNETLDLTAAIGPDDINVPYTVTWTVSDPAILRVSPDTENPAVATVTGLTGGNAAVTVKAGDVTATCKVTVNVKLIGITVSPSNVRVQGGETVQLTAGKNPVDALDEVTFSWNSSDENIATVDQTGLVTGKKDGTATITVRGGGFEATATVTVVGNASTTVANIKNNFFPIGWKSNVANLETVTVEWLMRADKWVTDQNNSVNTVFGIEGQWLLRIGDVGIGQNQLQLATNHGNNTPEVRFDTNRWYHVAVVYDYTSRNVSYYVNGSLVATGSGFATQSVNLTSNCFIGKSYDNSRSFCGDIAEVRVWKTGRSQAEIAASMYELRGAQTDLVAYWKFDEGAGNTVKDHSGNGNDITANAAIVWKEVEGGINVE